MTSKSRPPNMPLQRARRPRIRSGRSLRSSGSPLNGRALGVIQQPYNARLERLSVLPEVRKANKLDRLAKISGLLVAIYWLAAAPLSFGQSTLQQPGGTPNPPTAPAQTAQPVSSAGDSVAAKVVAAGLGGFLAWMLTKCVGLLILRRRLVAYLLIVINEHLRQYQESVAWLAAVREQTIKEGYRVERAATYTKDSLDDLTDVRQDCLKLLSKFELIRVTKLMQRMWEIEALLDGFCGSLDTYKSKEKVLDGSDVEYLRRKQDRILSYIRVLPAKVNDLNQPPLDYSGIIGPETLVTSPSTIRPLAETERSSQVIGQ